MKKRLVSIILVAVLFVGISVLIYPAVSNYWNTRVQSRAVVNYEEKLDTLGQEDFSAMRSKADEYNDKISKVNFPFLYHDEVKGYNDTLNVSGNGIMGYITIDKIGVELPIYHGTSKEVLNVAVGHIEGSSLPVGGEGTHCVLSAHRGLPHAKLFTNLDRMDEGDTFRMKVLDQVLTYRVDQVKVVKPEEINELQIKEGKDYCTLVTCTPYGINSHRLLVRGVRVDNEKEANIYVANEAFRIEPLVVTPIIATPILLALLVVLLVKYPNGVRAKKGANNEN